MSWEHLDEENYYFTKTETFTTTADRSHITLGSEPFVAEESTMEAFTENFH